MIMRALHYFYQFWGLFIHCCTAPNSQKEDSTFFIPKTATLSTFNNIPWLVTIDESCQGIMLSQWWILSTINCLTKLKYLNSDISKLISKEEILHGDKICMHPNFNPSDGYYPIKGVIGMMLLELPIGRKEVALPQTFIFRERCFHCVYRHCSVYQYQKNTKFENNMKKLSVKILDISFCSHQHNPMPKSNNLCIWSHQKEDCWIQQGSPVFCTFGSHWELVGLVSEFSRACGNPTLVIKTAPYLSWIRWLIKANEKPLEPMFSLFCSFYPAAEYNLSNNKRHADFSSHGFSLQSLITSSKRRQHWNSSPVFFVSNNKDSSPGIRKLYFQSTQLFPTSKFPMKESWKTSIYKTLSTSKSAVSCSNQIPNHFECIIHSEAQIPQITSIPFGFPQRNALKSEYENMNSLRYWADLLNSKTVFHTISPNAGQSLILFSNQIEGFQVAPETYSLHSKIKPSIFSSNHQSVLGSWLEITPDFRSWTQAPTVPYETGTVMWIPFQKEITQTQIYNIVGKITTGTYLETYNLNSLASSLVSKIKMLTHSRINNYESQYSSITPKLGLVFNEAWYLVRSQRTATKRDRYMISPAPISILHPSMFSIPYDWPLSKTIPFLPWSHYKPSNVRHTNQLDTTSLLSKHEATIVKQPKQTQSSKINPYMLSETDIVWTQAETSIVKDWLNLLEDTATTSIHSQFHELKDWTQSKNNRVTLWTQTEEPPSSSWTLSEVDTYTPWTSGKYSNLIPLIDPIIYTMPLWNQNEPTKKPKTDTFTYWTQMKMSSINLRRKPLRNIPISGLKSEPKERNNLAFSESYVTSLWTKAYTKINSIVTTQASDKYPTLNLKKQIKIDMTKLTSMGSPLETSWPHQVFASRISYHGNSPLFYLMNLNYDVITTWLQTKTQFVSSWHPSERELVIPQTQYEALENNLWSKTPSNIDIPHIRTTFSTGSLWTQTEVISELTIDNTKTVTSWNLIFDDFKKTCTKNRLLAFNSFTEVTTKNFISLIQTGSQRNNLWKYHISDKIPLRTQLVYPSLSQWTGSIAPTTTVWLKNNSSLVNLWPQQVSYRLTLPWPQAVSPQLNLQSQFVIYTILSPLLQSEYEPISLWQKSASDKIIVPWPQPELLNKKTQPLSDTKILSGPQPELIPEYLQTIPVSDRFISQWPQDISPTKNMRTPLIYDTLLIPTQQWPLRQTLRTNLRTLLAEQKTTTQFQSQYLIQNMLIFSISDKVTLPGSKSKSLPAYLWGWPISDTMMQTLTQDKNSVKSQWSPLMYDPTPSSWSLDNFPATKESGQLTSDEVILSRFQVPSPKANLFSPLITHTVILPWPQYIYSPINRERFSESDKITPLWSKTKFSPANIIRSYVSDITMPHWPQEESSEENQWLWNFPGRVTQTWTPIWSLKLSMWTLIDPNRQTLNVSPSRNLLFNHLADIITRPFTHTESSIFTAWIHPTSVTIPELYQIESTGENKQSLFLYDTYMLPWALSQQQAQIPWTGKTVNELSQWTKTEVLIVNSWTQGTSDVQTPEIKHWTHLISDLVLLRNQATSSTTHFWKKYGADIFKANLQLTTAKYPTQPTPNIFKHIEISRMKNPTLDMRSTQTLWKLSEIIQLKSWNQSPRDIVSQWITDKSFATHVFPTLIFDKVLPFDHARSPLLSQWTQTEGDAIIWREAKTFKTYVQTNSHHKIMTKWGPSEFSDEIVQMAPESGAEVLKKQDIFKYFIPRVEDTYKVANMKIQTESPAINHFAKLVANTRITRTQGDFLAINIDTQVVPDKVTLRKQTKYLLTNNWIQKENIIINNKKIFENHWMQPATETVKLCIYTVYSTFNSYLYKEKTVTGSFQDESEEIKNPWEKANLPNIYFTQHKFLSSPCINGKIYKFIPWTQVQYIPEYHLAEVPDSKTMSWSENKSFFTNAGREATFSNVIYWNHFNSLSVNPSLRAMTSIIIPWTQEEILSEDTWIGYYSSEVIHWIQETSELEHSETVSLFPTVITLMQPEYVPVVPWTQPMDLRYPVTDRWILPSYNHIIWTHPEPSDVIMPTNSFSETLTPLIWDDSQLKNHWAQSVSDKFIPWTKFLSVSEKLYSEGIFSTFLPWTKFITTSEVASIYPTFDSITPWHKTKFSSVTTCILSDYHVCKSWNHNGFSKSKLKDATNFIVKQKFLRESHLDLLKPKVTSRFMLWILDTLSVQTGFKAITSTTAAQIKTESLRNEMLEVLTTNEILNLTEFTPGQFYIHSSSVDKSLFLKVTKIDENNFITVSNTNVFRISMQAQTYVSQHSILTEQTPVLLAPTETIEKSMWSFSELSWRVPIPLADGYWPQHEYHNTRNWFETKTEKIRSWTQPYFQTITIYTLRSSKGESWIQHKTGIKSWINSATGMFNEWTQSETEHVRLSNVPNLHTGRPWFQVEANRNYAWFPLITNTVRVLPQSESQVTRLWTQTVSDMFLSQDEIEPEMDFYMSYNNAVSSRFPIQNSLRQRTKLEPEIVTSLIQQEWQIAHSRDRFETRIPKTGYNFETDTLQILLTYSKSDEIKLWTQPESLLVRRWPEDAIVSLSSLIQHDGIKHWPQLDYETTLSLAKLNVDIINPWIQPKTSTETLENIPWTHSDIELSHSLQTQLDSTLLFPTENNEMWHWLQLEYETTQSLVHPTVGIINPWIQHKVSTETLEIIPWTHSDIEPSHSLQTQLDSTLLFPTENNEMWHWLQLEYETTQSSVHPTVGIINPWIQHKVSTETLEIIPWTHSDIEPSHSLQTQLDSTLLFPTENNEMWHWLQLEYETTQSSVHPTVGIINPWIQHKVSTETLEIIPWTHSDIEPSHSLQTQLDSTLLFPTENNEMWHWLQLEYETTQSSVHPTVGIINPWIQHKVSTETLEIIPWTHSDIEPSHSLQTQIDLFRLWNQPQTMTTQIWNPTVEPQSLTAGVTILPSFQIQERPLSEESTLTFRYHSGYEDKNSLQPLSPRKSKLNVSLAECHLSMVWKDNLQALWVYKTAVVSHETTACGLRPGLVPHCPNCWEAEIGEFPWMVSVQLSYSHFCAGSILSEKWILTSSRCANFIKQSESLALVQVGLIDLQDPTQGKTVGIHRSMPYFSPRGPLGPGLIFLKEPLHFQPLVLPICLEDSQENERHIQLYDCWLPSWSLMRGSPGILQKRHLSIIQVINCAKFWPQLNEFTFCVEAKKAMGESGCKGDLGAPLVCHLQQKDTWVQMGILIHFDEHCTKPYVFSQVSPFIFWIQRVTHPSLSPWPHQRPLTTSPFNSLLLSTFTSTSVVRPHFISLPHPQALAHRISLQYTMPWQAMIFSCGNQICSGSIISSYWVLTAAHCVKNMNPEDTVVVLGLRHPGTPLKVVKVTTILLHERFRLLSQAARNDLALILLQEGQSAIHMAAPLGNMKNLNTSECWLSGPQILKQGDILENPEMLQIQVMRASNCTYLYPDIGSSTVCYISEARGPEINMESVSPGSAIMCRPLSENGKWRQIGFTSLKHLATIVGPHFSWILSSSAKAGYPLNQVLHPWIENSKASNLVIHPNALLLSTAIVIAVKRVFYFVVYE